MRIGLSDIHYAPISINSTTGKAEFGTPVKLAGAIKADVSIETNETKFYSDDMLSKIIREFKEGKIVINVEDIGAKHASALLGSRIDKNGALVSSGTDSPPYVAIGFRARKDGDAYSYYWYYKAKFGVPSENFQTKGESINAQTSTIEGLLTVGDNPDAHGKRNWGYRVDSDDPDVPGEMILNWFKAVVEPDFTGIEPGGDTEE